jgi:hypothetical protein
MVSVVENSPIAKYHGASARGVNWICLVLIAALLVSCCANRGGGPFEGIFIRGNLPDDAPSREATAPRAPSPAPLDTDEFEAKAPTPAAQVLARGTSGPAIRLIC